MQIDGSTLGRPSPEDRLRRAQQKRSEARKKPENERQRLAEESALAHKLATELLEIFRQHAQAVGTDIRLSLSRHCEKVKGPSQEWRAAWRIVSNIKNPKDPGTLLHLKSYPDGSISVHAGRQATKKFPAGEDAIADALSETYRIAERWSCIEINPAARRRRWMRKALKVLGWN